MPQSAPPGAETLMAAESRLAAPAKDLVILTSETGLAAIAAQWRALEAECRDPPTVFQSFDWAQAWAKAYLPHHRELSLCILLGYEAGQLVFILPLQHETRHGLRQLCGLSQRVGQYAGMLCHKTADPESWMAACIAEIKRRRLGDVVRLRQLRHTAALHGFAMRHFFTARQDERAPALDLAPFKDADAYDARYTHDQRHRRRRVLKKIGKYGPVTFETLRTGPAQATAAREALSAKLKWLKARGRYNVVLGDPAFAAMIEALALQESPGFVQVVTRMQAGATTVAWEMGYRYQNRHYHFLTAHQDGMTDLSPGRLMLDYSMKQAISDSVAEFDLLPPFHPHKASFSSRLEPVSDWYLPLTLKGALYGHLVLGLIRPALRQLYHVLPEAITRPLLRLLGIGGGVN